MVAITEETLCEYGEKHPIIVGFSIIIGSPLVCLAGIVVSTVHFVKVFKK